MPDFDDDEPLTWRDRLPLLPLFADAKKLSKNEAKKSEETLIAAIQQYGVALDTGIALTSRTHAEEVIWGDLSPIEAEALASVLLRLGTKYAPVAVVVRAAVASYGYLEVGMITVPRFRKTVAYYLHNGFVLSFRFRAAPPSGPQVMAPVTAIR